MSEAKERLKAAAYSSARLGTDKVIPLADALREIETLEVELEDANAGCIHCGGEGYVGEGDFCPCSDGQVHRLKAENARLIQGRDELHLLHLANVERAHNAEDKVKELTQELQAAEDEIESAILDTCERCRIADNEPWRNTAPNIRWSHVGGVYCDAWILRERRYQRSQRAEAQKV